MLSYEPNGDHGEDYVGANNLCSVGGKLSYDHDDQVSGESSHHWVVGTYLKEPHAPVVLLG